jgi:hypothetical protein
MEQDTHLSDPAWICGLCGWEEYFLQVIMP